MEFAVWAGQRYFAVAGDIVAGISVTDGENQVTIPTEVPGLGGKDAEVSPGWGALAIKSENKGCLMRGNDDGS